VDQQQEGVCVCALSHGVGRWCELHEAVQLDRVEGGREGGKEGGKVSTPIDKN